jgi:hypothetical protein
VVRSFPENFPVIVRFSPPSGGAVRDKRVTVGQRGKLTFPVQDQPGQYWRSFTLRFDEPQRPWFICESPPALVSPPLARATRYAPGGSPPPRGYERFFALPGKWLMRQGDWRVVEPGFIDNGQFLSPTATISHTQPSSNIGSELSPVRLVLDPYWHFLRFEYYDRYYGNAHLDSPPRPALRKRISVPPVRLWGFRNDPSAAGNNPNAYSNWTISMANPADSADMLQCLPFILRRDANGVAFSPPDGSKLGLRFRTPANAHIYSFFDRERRLIISPPPPFGPERLRFYDLPRQWNSQRYYTRHVASSPPAPGKFFHTLSAAEISQAEQKEHPLVFCLDDMVLAVGDPAAATVTAVLSPPADRVAIFGHRFDERIAQCNPQGLYKLLSPPMPDAFDLPRSDVQVINNYIYDYPDWTRLVLAQGNLFEVFDQRMPRDILPSGVIGARAAVRWVDGTAPFPGIAALIESPPGTWIAAADNFPVPGRCLSPPFAPRIDVPAANPLFSMQPFFQQRPPWPGWRFDGSHLQIGRYDIALLRCADIQEGNEVAINFNYFRHHFNYLSPPPPSPPVPVPLPVSDAQYALLLCQNVANRWSGNEPGVSENRAIFVPRIPSPPAPPPPFKAPAIWFPQALRREQAHFTLQLTPGGRDNRGSLLGTGDTGADSYVEEPAQSPPEPSMVHWFTAAHETGHMGGLPDEYNERWNAQSYGQASFNSLLPGDPYETDGRDDTVPLSTPQSAMMNGVKMMRNRYFWHSAEWVRRVIGYPLQVGLGPNYPDYWLPRHPQPAQGRTYYSWPLAHHVSPPAWPRTGHEIYLFPLGKDHFSQRVLAGGPPRGPFDGILVVVAKIVCRLPANVNPVVQFNQRRNILNGMQAGVRRTMNNRFWVEGTLNYGSPPRPWRLNRCLLHFVPQVVVFNYPHGTAAEQATANSMTGNYGYDFQVNVTWPGAVTHVWTPPDTLDITANGLHLNIDPAFASSFPFMIIGQDKAPNAVTTNDLTPVVQRVIPGAVVHLI